MNYHKDNLPCKQNLFRKWYIPYNTEREDMAPKHHYPKGEVVILVPNQQDKPDFYVLVIWGFLTEGNDVLNQ